MGEYCLTKDLTRLTPHKMTVILRVDCFLYRFLLELKLHLLCRFLMKFQANLFCLAINSCFLMSLYFIELINRTKTLFFDDFLFSCLPKRRKYLICAFVILLKRLKQLFYIEKVLLYHFFRIIMFVGFFEMILLQKRDF